MSEIATNGEGLSEVRRQMVAHTRGVVGLDAGTDPDRYIALVSNGSDSQQMRRDMLTMSGCALVVRGLWWTFGVEHPILTAAYRIGHAVSDLETIANERGAWRDHTSGELPKPGDVVIVAKGQPLEHVFTVLSAYMLSATTAALCSVDGGQRDARHAEMIKRYERSWRIAQSGVMDIAIEPGVVHPVRPVSGWIDFEAVINGQ